MCADFQLSSDVLPGLCTDFQLFSDFDSMFGNSLYQKVRRNLVQIELDDYVRKSGQKCGHENHEKSIILLLKKYPLFASSVPSINFRFIKLPMVHSDQKVLFSRRVDYQRQIGDLG